MLLRDYDLAISRGMSHHAHNMMLQTASTLASAAKRPARTLAMDTPAPCRHQVLLPAHTISGGTR